MLDDVYLLLYIKEKFNISNKAWSELSFICKDFPSTYSLKKRIEGLNAHWNLTPTPGASDGVQVSLAASLCDQIERLVTVRKLVPSEILKIKVSGDGTQVEISCYSWWHRTHKSKDCLHLVSLSQSTKTCLQGMASK